MAIWRPKMGEREVKSLRFLHQKGSAEGMER
jgi:hypothetical protein